MLEVKISWKCSKRSFYTFVEFILAPPCSKFGHSIVDMCSTTEKLKALFKSNQHHIQVVPSFPYVECVRIENKSPGKCEIIYCGDADLWEYVIFDSSKLSPGYDKKGSSLTQT